MNLTSLRFAANIRFVTLPEWRSLHSGVLKNAYQAGSCPGWDADDYDQFVLQRTSETASIGPCVAGGLTGNLKYNSAPFPLRVGMFHLIPRANLDLIAQKTIDHRMDDNKDNLVQPLGGLLCGGQDYDLSRMLAATLVARMVRLLGRKPTYFLEQDSNSSTQLGYDGQSDTWYINVDSIDDRPIDTVEDLKRLFKKRYVSPDDSVFLGMTSQTPLSKEDIEHD